MAADSKYKMSPERKKELEEQLHELETVKANEVSELIKEARSFGDLSENSEYDEAKNEQGKLYSKIAELKDLIENAEIINSDHIIGKIFELLDMDDQSTSEYLIVGSTEANPMKGQISDESPLGRALIGKREGELVTVEAPAGTIKFRVLTIKKNDKRSR